MPGNGLGISPGLEGLIQRPSLVPQVRKDLLQLVSRQIVLGVRDDAGTEFQLVFLHQRCPTSDLSFGIVLSLR